MTTQTLTRQAHTASAAPATTAAKGWYDDPQGEHKMRFHDGSTWTDHTTHHGPVPCRGCG